MNAPWLQSPAAGYLTNKDTCSASTKFKNVRDIVTYYCTTCKYLVLPSGAPECLFVWFVRGEPRVNTFKATFSFPNSSLKIGAGVLIQVQIFDLENDMTVATVLVATVATVKAPLQEWSSKFEFYEWKRLFIFFFRLLFRLPHPSHNSLSLHQTISKWLQTLLQIKMSWHC